MTETEKAAAFDALCDVFTNHWNDEREGGYWSWWNPNPAGGPRRNTKAEAIASLVEWAQFLGPKWRAKNEKLAGQRLPLPVVEAPPPCASS